MLRGKLKKMLRITIEIIPKGVESLARKIGLIEIANDATGNLNTGNYKVLLKKTPPFTGFLDKNWRRGFLNKTDETEEIISGSIEGFSRKRLGVYDLLFLALVSCGISKRNNK